MSDVAQDPPAWLLKLATVLDAGNNLSIIGSEATIKVELNEELAAVVGQLLDELDGAVQVRDGNGRAVARRALSVGSSYSVTVAAQHTTISQHVYCTIGELLRPRANLCAEPASYLVLKPHFKSWDGSPEVPSGILQYRQAIAFAGLVTGSSHYAVNSSVDPEAVFIMRSAALRVPIQYGNDDLRELADVPVLVSELQEGPWPDTRRSLFAKAIVDSLQSVGQSKPFPFLLDNYSAVVHAFRRNLQIFESQFEFETQSERLEAEKRGFISQLSAIVTDVQNKVLAIPGALLLVGSQLRQGNGLVNVLSNSAVFLATVGVSLLVWLLTSYQLGMVKHARVEIEARTKRWKAEAPYLVKGEGEPFESVTDHASKVERSIFYIRLMAGIVQIIALGLYLKMTPELTKQLLDWFQAIPSAVGSLWPAWGDAGHQSP